MWRALAIAVVIIVAGCTKQPSLEEKFAAQVADHNAKVAADRAKTAEIATKERKAISDLTALALAPAEAFRSEKPRSCKSDNVRKSRSMALKLMDDIRPETHGQNAVIAIAAAGLDVADILRRAGCDGDARLIYDEVVRIYLGASYAALRDRAKIGIDDLTIDLAH